MIGVLVSDTLLSEKNYNIFQELNESAKIRGSDVLLYVNLGAQLLPSDFAIMNATEMSHFYGKSLVATCLTTADMLRKAAVNAKKSYYIWDLSFLLSNYDFNSVYNILSNIQLIVRSDEHKKIIKNLFNLDSKVEPKFKVSIWNSLN